MISKAVRGRSSLRRQIVVHQGEFPDLAGAGEREGFDLAPDRRLLLRREVGPAMTVQLLRVETAPRHPCDSLYLALLYLRPTIDGNIARV